MRKFLFVALVLSQFSCSAFAVTDGVQNLDVVSLKEDDSAVELKSSFGNDEFALEVKFVPMAGDLPVLITVTNPTGTKEIIFNDPAVSNYIVNDVDPKCNSPGIRR